MIIGIAGNINSGKDTIASMLNYIISVGKHKAKFSDWMIKQKVYDTSYSNRITHFADVIKLNLSNIFNFDVSILNDRNFKDELWYSPFTGKFIEEKDTNDLYKIELENYLELNCSNIYQIVKLRTLIQIYAEKCKTLFGNRIWINSTITKAKYINQFHKHCLIPDVRFQDEVKAIWESDGIVIKIERPNNEIQSNHISENNPLRYNYYIKNDSTLSNLFYKVLAIYERIEN